MTDHSDPPRVPPRQPQDHPPPGDDRLLRHARRRGGRLPGPGRRLALQRRCEPSDRAARVSRTSSTIPEKDDAHGAASLGVRVRELRGPERDLPATKEPASSPAFCIDHGMTLSYYWTRAPDGNHVELQVDVFGDWAKSTRPGCSTSEALKDATRSALRRPRPANADDAHGMSFDGDPRKGDGRRLRAPAGPGRHPGDDVMRLCRLRCRRRTKAGDRQRRSRARPGQPGRTALPRRRAHSGAGGTSAGVPRDRTQLRRSHRGNRHEGARLPDVLQQAGHLRERALRSDSSAARVEALDYEGELGIVIGTRCRHVPRPARTR